MNRRNELINHYFSLGLQHQEILSFLYRVHGVDISLSTLKRLLRQMGLYRKRNYTNLEVLLEYFQQELSTSSQMHGYRWFHLRCLQRGLTVTQETVRLLLTLLDPQGVEMRQRKRLRRRQYYNRGANYLWHMDSYDKLKPYGICINGCIDGYSRHIVWLRAGRTASDPKVVAGYYLDSVEALGGIPLTIRCDMGTENGIVKRLQEVLSETAEFRESARPCFIYGKSTGNQRIECWWSILRKHNAQFWLNVFEMIRDDGFYSGTQLDKALMQFAFLEIIQNELDEVALEWNVHRIQRSRNSIAPAGRPISLFEMPQLYDARNYLVLVDNNGIDVLKTECLYYKESCDADVGNLCKHLMLETGRLKTVNVSDAIDLYVFLRSEIMKLLELE